MHKELEYRYKHLDTLYCDLNMAFGNEKFNDKVIFYKYFIYRVFSKYHLYYHSIYIYI